MTLLLVAVMGVAFVGYFVGIDAGVPRPEVPTRITDGPFADSSNTVVLPATSYTDVGRAPLGPTRQWTQSLDALRTPAPDLLTTIVVDPELKHTSLQARSERRAYNGAPPVIPHEVDQLGSDTCLTCHGDGFRLENRTARQQPHPYLSQCVQCHAPTTPNILTPSMLAENLFVGVEAPFEGARAWPGAPPVVPHSTWMRDNCLACHGPNGWPGMETTHPWRQQCLQCHAPSSTLDHTPTALQQMQMLAPLLLDAP